MPIAELRHIAALAAATSNHLRIEFAALGEGGASFHPAPGEWCAKEVVGHLIEADRHGFTGRIATIMGADRPTLEAWDQKGVAAARNDCERSIEELLDEFSETRREGLAQLETLTTGDLARVGIHPQVGEITISDLFHEWPFHDRDHLQQILQNVRALLWPGMGASRKFSTGRGVAL